MSELFYSAAELAAMQLPNFPTTRQAVDYRAKREGWHVTVKKGIGARGRLNVYALNDLPKDLRTAIQAKTASDLLEKLIVQSEHSRSVWKEKMATMRKADFGEADIADKQAAFIYTTNEGYRFINPKLIEHKGDLAKLDDGRLQFVRALDALLSRAPAYQGTVFRRLQINGMPDAETFLNTHQPGALVRYSNYTSTSRDKRMLSGDADIVLTIHSRSGVDISRLSQFEKQEAEVLLPRQAVYRVVEHVMAGGRHRITLEEVAETAHNEGKIMQLSLLSE